MGRTATPVGGIPNGPEATMNAIEASIHETESKFGTPARWAERHLAAWRAPEGFEIALKAMIVGLSVYGRETQRQFSSQLGADYFLGPACKEIAEAIIVLLNGDLGRFDGGTLDALVRAICVEHGIELGE